MMGAAELAPSGVLRMGLVEAPHAGLFFVEKEPLRGVTVDLGAALAKELSLPIDYRVFPNSGECTEATSPGEIDVAFMPVDEERRAKVAFGPAYYLLRSTYLVSGASGLMSLAAVDEEHVRVVGIFERQREVCRRPRQSQSAPWKRLSRWSAPAGRTHSLFRMIP